jgi:hypothetical protein
MGPVEKLSDWRLMSTLRYIGQFSARSISKRLRRLRRSLALIETAIGALRAYARIELGDACPLSFIARGSAAKPVQQVRRGHGRYN